MAILSLLLYLALLVLFLLLLQLNLNVRRYIINKGAAKASDLNDLPTISLCIPARNETHALEDCLISAVSSDYPKLEIIVLDDCSQDKTSQIIRSFAQSGVRFVRGEAPSGGWLGKNNAYEVLAKEARGEYLVFMSVDTRMESDALLHLVAYVQEHKLSMVSVLPRRADGWRASVIFSPLRYFWQLVLPLGVNTPTATSLWAIRGDTLEKLGGFTAYKDKIMIENVLATHLFNDDTYRFLVANDSLKIWYAKKWSSQVETSIRLWYPQLGKNIFYSVLAMLTHFLLFILPLISLVIGITSLSSLVIMVSLVALLLQSLLFLVYVRTMHTNNSSLLGILLSPLIGLQEMVLIAASAIQYKRGYVDWKGRNICYPTLRRVN